MDNEMVYNILNTSKEWGNINRYKLSSMKAYDQPQ